MFGYVIVNEKQLSEAEHRRMRAFYCGVCRSLKKRYGIPGQMTLSFDMAFLAMLLSSLYEPETAETMARCAVHPKQKHLSFSNELIDYAADMNVALFYYKCRDSWQDEKSLPAHGMERMLKQGFARVREQYPRQCEAIGRNVEALAKLEKERCGDLDALCAPTGEMMAAGCAAAFETLPLENDLSVLRNTLYSGIWTKYEGIRHKAEKAGKEKLDGE